MLILSFLPLSSPITPEGSILHKELGIQLEDSKYIGLDKFSFYTKTDFDTLPKLKQALIKADMWHLTELKPTNPMERKEDHILKNFFMEDITELEFVEEYSWLSKVLHLFAFKNCKFAEETADSISIADLQCDGLSSKFVF